MAATPGTVIGGRYRVETRLGAGGVGVVWSGIRIEDGLRVAIKMLLPAASAHAELVSRFKREAELLERIHSNFVSRVIDFLSDPTHGLVLIMEFIDGPALNAVLRKNPLSVEQAIDVGWDVLSGVADLHQQQIVHRDLKPGNVILHALPDGRSRAVIVDFGMSRIMVNMSDPEGEEVSALTRTGTALGTLEYMAPEQMLNSRSVTGAADIYAVGVMLYRAVAGQHMFGDINGPTLARTKLLNEAPPLVTGRADPIAQRFETIVMKMIRLAPEERHQRAEDVLADLAEIRHRPSAPPRESMPDRASAPFASSPDPSGQTSSPTATSIRSTSYDAAESGRRIGLVWILAASIAILGIVIAGGILSYKRGLLMPASRRPAASELPVYAPTASQTAAPATSIEPLAPEPTLADAAAADAAPP